MRLSVLLFKGYIRRQPLRIILIAICSMFCFTGQLGLSWSAESIVASRKTFEEKCQTADMIFYTEKKKPGELKKTFKDIPGVSAVSEGCISELFPCVCADDKVRSVRFVSMLDGSVGAPIIEGTGKYALSYGYAVSFDKSAVEQIVFPDGQCVEINATAAMPLFAGVYVDRFIPSTDGDIIDIYTEYNIAKKYMGEEYVNYLMIEILPGYDPETVMRDIITQREVFISYSAMEEPAYKSSLELERIVVQICNLYPWIMVIIGLIFVSIFLAGVAGRSKDSIALLRTEGADIWSVFWGLYSYGITAISIGLLCALPAAVILADYVVTISLKNMCIPHGGLSFSMIYPTISLIAGVLINMVATGIGVYMHFRKDVYSVLGSFPQIRSKTRVVIFFTGLSTATAVAMTTLSLMVLDSLNAVRAEQFLERYNYDVQLIYDGFRPVSELELLQESGFVGRCEPMIFGEAKICVGEKEESVTCVALSDTPLLLFRDDCGAVMETPQNSIVLSPKTAQALDAKAGDSVDIQIYYGSKNIQVSCKVAEVAKQSSAFVEMVSIDTVEAYLDSTGVMNNVAVQVKEDRLEEFVRYAHKLPKVSAVQTGQAGRQRFDQRYLATKILIGVVIAVSCLLGLSVCVLMAYLQWKDDIRRNTILWMLGENPIRLLGKSIRVRLIGLLGGFVSGMFLADIVGPWFLREISTNSIWYPCVHNPGTVYLVILLCVGYEMICQGVYCMANRQHWNHCSNKI